MSAYNVLNTAIYNQLSGGTALISAIGGGSALYYLQAPDHAARPFVTWQWVAGGDENKSPHRSKNIILLVRSFANNPEQAGTIDNLVDQRLHLQALTVTGWTNFWLARESEVSLVDNPPSGEKSYMAGAQYRVRLAK